MDEQPSVAMTGSSLNGASLTTTERLQASSLAASVVLQIQSLKTPLRRAVMEQIRWLLGEE